MAEVEDLHRPSVVTKTFSASGRDGPMPRSCAAAKTVQDAEPDLDDHCAPASGPPRCARGRVVPVSSSETT
jgi:hypothetical protein